MVALYSFRHSRRCNVTVVPLIYLLLESVSDDLHTGSNINIIYSENRSGCNYKIIRVYLANLRLWQCKYCSQIIEVKM
jgi:hypothetical protein